MNACKYRADCYCTVKGKIVTRVHGAFPECDKCENFKVKPNKGKESKK